MSDREIRPPAAAVSLEPLQDLIVRLRAPDGCPWDRKQTLGDVRAYVIEEAHEVAAAIDQAVADDEHSGLAEELGDLLFQIAFIGQLEVEAGRFDLKHVVDGICDKMIARHPHVFATDVGTGDAVAAEGPQTAEEVVVAWERRKLESKRQTQSTSHLDGVPTSLPALVGSYRLTQKAAGLGFDWPDVSGVFAKVREELDELEAAVDSRNDDATREELGDLLFTMANLARHLGHDPEAAAAHANLKFRRRFGRLEQIFEQRHDSLGEADLETMDAVWNAVKAEERS